MRYLLFICTFFIINCSFAHGGKGQGEKNSDQDSTSIKKDSATEQTVGKISKEEIKHLLKDSKSSSAQLSDFPSLHPLVVHFPIVLLILAPFLQLISLFLFKKELGYVTFGFLLLGFIGAYVAARYVHPHTENLEPIAAKVLAEHETYADFTLWAAGLGLIIKTVTQFLFRGKIIFEGIIVLVLAAGAYFISISAHHGAQLVHIEGVGPQGKFLELERNQ